MNKKVFLIALGCFINLYVNLNSVGSGSLRSPRPQIYIDEQVPKTPTIFDKTTKDLETGFAKRRGPVSNIDPLTLSTPPQSPLTHGGPHARPFGSLDEIVSDKPVDEITRQTSFSDRMAERTRNKEANKAVERLNEALKVGKTQNSLELPQPAIKELPLSRDFYPEIIIPGGSVKNETKVSEPLTPKEKNIEADWWGPVVDPRGSNQIDQIRKLQQAATELPESGQAQVKVVTVGREGNASDPLTRNSSLLPMEEENGRKLSSLSDMPDLPKKKGKQSNLSVKTGQEAQESPSKPTSSKLKKKLALPKKPVQPEDFKRNFGQAFLAKFNEEFGLQGGPEYANALETVRRIAIKDQFVESTKSVIDARKRLNAANKAFAQAVLEDLDGVGPYYDQVSRLANKTNFSDDEMTVLLRNSGMVDQQKITAIAQAKKALDDAIKKETASYIQEAKDAFIEISPDVAAIKKTETRLLEKVYSKMRDSGLPEDAIKKLSDKKNFSEDDRVFISSVLIGDEKATFDGLKKALDDANNESSRKLNNLLSFVPTESLDETKIETEIGRNNTLGGIRGDFVLPENQIKKAKALTSPQSPSGLLKESSFKKESEALGDIYYSTPKALQTLIPDSPTVESTKAKKPKSLDKKLSSLKKNGPSLEKQGDEEVLAEYARLAAETKTSRNNTQ